MTFLPVLCVPDIFWMNVMPKTIFSGRATLPHLRV